MPHTLLSLPARPAPPQDGTPEQLLTHAAEFGAYVKTLETRLRGWIEWTEGAP